MLTYESIPLTLDDAEDGSLRQTVTAFEDWMAYHAAQGLVTEYPSPTNRYNKSLTLDSANSVLIGTYVDTFYNEPVGTHPGTSISEGTISTNLYQMEDSATPTRFRNAYSIPVTADSDGNIYEMSDNGIFELAQRIAGHVHVNQFAGAYRLGETSPGQGWFKWIDGAFTDTRTSGDVDYHIWRLGQEVGNNNEPDVPDHFLVKLKDGISPDLQELTAEETKEIAREILLIGQASTGVGDYELRSSAQGAPTASGTWVARGTALDTKHVVAPVQYTSEQFTSPQYTTQYTGQYVGQYTGISFANVDVQYSGFRTFTFQGNRNYQGNYQGSRNYVGSYAGERSYGGEYAGNRYFSGTRNFSGNRPFSKQYVRPVQSAGLRPITSFVKSFYSGSRQKPRSFAGVRAIAFSGNYAGFRTTPFSGFRKKPLGLQPFGGFASGTYYIRNFRVAGPFPFQGSRPFSAQYVDTSAGPFSGRPIQYQGQVRGQVPFSRISISYYSGSRIVYYASPTPTPTPNQQQIFIPNIFIPFNPNINLQQLPADVNSFGGVSTTSGRETDVVSRITYENFASYVTNYYLGQRPKLFAGPGDFSGTRQFAGERFNPDFYGGTRSFSGLSVGTYYYPYPYQGYRLYNFANNFGGPFPYPFGGVRYKDVNQNFAGVRGFSNNYVRNQVFYVDVPAQYSGTRQFAGVRFNPVPEGFVGASRGFVKNEQFQGSRSYGKQYQGNRNYQGNYQGSRNYVGVYAGPRGDQFTGQVPTTYTRQYTGTYTGVYAGNYTSQYSNQYTGQTITSQIQTIETYTLYCRIVD